MDKRQLDALAGKTGAAVPLEGYRGVCDAMKIEALGFWLDDDLLFYGQAIGFIRKQDIRRTSFAGSFQACGSIIWPIPRSFGT